MGGPSPLLLAQHQITDAHVRERAPHHHLVVAPPRAVRVEVARRDGQRGEIEPRGRVRGDRSRRRDVVGRHGVPEDAQNARAHDIPRRRGLRRQADQIRRLLHVGGSRIPAILVALRHLETLPDLVAVDPVRRTRPGTVPVPRPPPPTRPPLLRTARDRAGTRGSRGVVPQWFGGEIDIDRPGQRIRDHQHGRRQIVGPHEWMDARFEVPVAAEDGGRHQLLLDDALGDGRRDGAGIADAGGAAVADDVEAQRLQIGHQARRVRSTRPPPANRERCWSSPRAAPAIHDAPHSAPPDPLPASPPGSTCWCNW